jgi:microcystin-dependent protein
MARAMAKRGEIREVAVASDRFDTGGVGRWEWKGWAIADGKNGTIDLTGRVRVGYSPSASNEYGRIGARGGQEKVTLDTDQMPRHNHGSVQGNTLPEGRYGLVRKSTQGDNRTVASTDPGDSGIEPDLTASPIPLPTDGGGQPHENRMPFVVVLTIQRI